MPLNKETQYELLPHYYVHLQTDTIEKGKNSFILQQLVK